MSELQTDRPGRIRAAPASQQSFPFVDADYAQAQADAYSLYQRNRDKLASRLLQVQVNKQETYISCLVDKGMLGLPLFECNAKTAEHFSQDPLEAPQYTSEDEALPDSNAEKVRDIEWLADHASEFVGWYLERNFEMLSSVGNAAEKQTILEWIFAPDFEGDFVEEGGRQIRTKAIYRDKVPFSFVWCCKAVGFDPDRMRDALIDTIRGAMSKVTPRHRTAYTAILKEAEERY